MLRNKVAAVLTYQNPNIRKTAGFLTVVLIEDILEVRHHYNIKKLYSQKMDAK